MNYLNRRLVLIKPVLLAGVMGVGLLPAIGHALPSIGNQFNADCGVTVFDGDDYAVEGGPCGPVDCDDTYRDVNPGESERCDDGFDNNCDANTDAVDAACQARNDDDDELVDRQKEAKRKRDRDEDHHDKDGDHHDKDDGDGKRDSRRKGRGSRDRD